LVLPVLKGDSTHPPARVGNVCSQLVLLYRGHVKRSKFNGKCRKRSKKSGKKAGFFWIRSTLNFITFLKNYPILDNHEFFTLYPNLESAVVEYSPIGKQPENSNFLSYIFKVIAVNKKATVELTIQFTTIPSYSTKIARMFHRFSAMDTKFNEI
jgi:hypothetical protein